MALLLLFVVVSIVRLTKGVMEYEGTSFVVAFPPPERNETGRLYIMNKYPATTCTLTTWNKALTINVIGNGQTVSDLPQGSLDHKSILVVCMRKVIAYAYFDDIDSGLASASPLIPVDSLSTEYSVPLVPSASAFVTVVALSDGTAVAVDLKSTDAFVSGKWYSDGDDIHYLLNKLDVLQLTTTIYDTLEEVEGYHFNRTEVSSNKRIAVFSGYTQVELSQSESSSTQTLHQITPVTKLETTYILPPIAQLDQHDAFVTTYVNQTNVTDFCCDGDDDSSESMFVSSLSSGVFGSWLQGEETVLFETSSPVTFIRLVTNDNLTKTYTTIVPPVEHYGYDYWIPNINYPSAEITRSVTILTYTQCVSAFGFTASWRNMTFGRNFSVTSIQNQDNLSRITTNPSCPFAVEVSYVGKDVAYGFFAVPNSAGPVEQDLKSSFNITCGVNQWYVTLETVKFQSSFQSNTSNIYLSNAFCSGVRDGSMVTFTYNYTDCNTREKENGNDRVFSNYLVEYEVDQQTGIADRVLWRYDIQCVRPRHEIDTITFNPVDNTTGIHIQSTSKVKGHQAVIEFFKDSSFTNQMTGNPLKVTVGSRVYVQVQTTVTDSVKLLIDNCYVSPGNRGDNSSIVPLIENRCASNRFVHILGSVDKLTRFDFDVFEIPHHHDNIYVTCDVSFCDLMDFSKECQHACQKLNP